MRRLLLALLLAACTQAPATPDAAATDAPIVDAPVDAGVVDVVDAGAPVDAAPPTDMASSDIAPPDVGVEATVPADVAAVDAPFVDAPVEAAVDAGPPAPTVAATMWRTRVEPLLVTRCGSCHLGTRFNLATLLRATDVFTEAESARNRETFVDHISLDVPSRSRILDKILPATDPDAMPHGADVRVADRSDPLVTTLTAWIEAERAERCPDCGPRSATSWIAYVDQPTIFSMIERSPIRTDRGERRGAKIYLRAVDPVTLLPRGEPVDFLGSFCPAGDDCDWGRLAVSNDGAQLAFECRMPLAGEPWIQRAWNLCIADIGPDGRARNARFLLPPGQRKTGATHARVDPFGVRPDSGVPSPWDVHFELRNRNDYDPTFSPDGSRVYFTSEAPDPRSGADMVQTYHGTFHLGHLVSARTDGSDLRTIYRNEGGSADSPTFLRSGDVVFHTWNLERMDRHMYIRATPDGMMEVPVFLGRVQGPDMWGRAVQLADGTLLGMTGRRRATTSLYSPFLAEHSAGISNVTNYTDGAWHGFKFMFPALESELDEYGFCTATTPEAAATAPRCSLSQRIDDPSWAPNGGVLVTSNPERTYIPEGEGFFLTFGRGAGVADRQASVAPYLPQHQGIAALDRDGTIRRLLDPPAGRMLRWPVWVGRRWAPRVRPQVTDETRHDAELHLADARVWMSFEENTNGFGSKIQNYTRLTEMTSVRVLRKMSAPNACILDTPYLRQSMGQADGFHPSALGMIDATGYEQLVLPASAGGTASGDVPLQADGSVAMRVPAGDLLLFQGIDANGRMVGQHRRVFTMPPGWHVDTSVRRAQYQSQCARCHGAIAATESFAASQDLPHLPAVMDFDTLAARAPPRGFHGALGDLARADVPRGAASVARRAVRAVPLWREPARRSEPADRRIARRQRPARGLARRRRREPGVRDVPSGARGRRGAALEPQRHGHVVLALSSRRPVVPRALRHGHRRGSHAGRARPLGRRLPRALSPQRQRLGVPEHHGHHGVLRARDGAARQRLAELPPRGARRRRPRPAPQLHRELRPPRPPHRRRAPRGVGGDGRGPPLHGPLRRPHGLRRAQRERPLGRSLGDADAVSRSASDAPRRVRGTVSTSCHSANWA